MSKIRLSNIVPIRQNYLVLEVNGKFSHTNVLPKDLKRFAAVIDTINNTEWQAGMWVPLCALGE